MDYQLKQVGVRLHGETEGQVHAAANDLGVVIKRIRHRRNGTIYGTGVLNKKYPANMSEKGPDRTRKNEVRQ